MSTSSAHFRDPAEGSQNSSNGGKPGVAEDTSEKSPSSGATATADKVSQVPAREMSSGADAATAVPSPNNNGALAEEGGNQQKQSQHKSKQQQSATDGGDNGVNHDEMAEVSEKIGKNSTNSTNHKLKSDLDENDRLLEPGDDDDDEDDDERPPIGDEQNGDDGKTILWRIPPEKSHSDWTINIVTVSDHDESLDQATSAPPQSSTHVYHVHKGILAAGPRRCDYFTRVFQNDALSATPSSSKTTQMELHELAARAFPVMLDYMYSSHYPLQIQSETATALHALGVFFENKRLRWDATQFLKNDISLQNCHVYYAHAKVFENEKVLKQIAKMCAVRKNVLGLTTSSPLIALADVEFWPQVLGFAARNGVMKEDTSRHASRLIYQVIKVKSSTMDTELFDMLTDENYLPFIDINVASHLLDAQEFFRAEIVDDNRYAASSWSSITSLQKRCVAAVSQNWLRLATAANRADFLSRQKPIILAELLDQVLQRAGDAVADYKKALDRALSNPLNNSGSSSGGGGEGGSTAATNSSTGNSGGGGNEGSSGTRRMAVNTPSGISTSSSGRPDKERASSKLRERGERSSSEKDPSRDREGALNPRKSSEMDRARHSNEEKPTIRPQSRAIAPKRYVDRSRSPKAPPKRAPTGRDKDDRAAPRQIKGEDNE